MKKRKTMKLFSYFQLIAFTALLTYLFFFTHVLFQTKFWMASIEEPAKAVKLLIYRHNIAKQKYPGVYWAKASDDKTGLQIHKEDLSLKGYTVFSSSYAQKVHLIDMNGNMVHEWSMPFSKAWPNPQHIDWVLPEHLHHITRFHLYPNGDLLLIYTGVGATPLGYGMAKINKNSELLWTYDEKVHHDAVIGTDNTIYTLTHEIREEKIQKPPKLQPPFYEDFLVQLSHEGKELKRISLYEAFRDSPAHNVLNQIRDNPTGGDTPLGDTLHPNTITLIPDYLSDASPILKEGHILISFRNMSLLAILNPETEKITWASYGPWRFQHDPQFLNDGTILLFDNEGHIASLGGASRIINVDLHSLQILWQYTGDAKEKFYSAFHGMLDPLKNGNILITESMGARLFEITPKGEIAWEYRSPWQVEDEQGLKLVPSFYEGKRYSFDELSFVSSL